MKLTEKLLRGSSLSLLDMLVKTAALFVMMPLMKGRLGMDGWGTWLLAMSMVNWFVLLDLGATFAGTRFLSSAWAGGNETRAAAVLRVLKRFFLPVAAGTAIVCIFLLTADLWLPGKPGLIAALAGLCGLAIALRFALRRGPVVLRACVRYDQLSGISIIRVLLQNGIMAWLLVKGAGLWAMAICYLLCDSLETMLQWAAARHLKPGDGPEPAAGDLPPLAKEMRAFSLLMVVAVIGETLRLQLGPALLGALSGVAVVPLFTVGTRLITMIEDVVNALFGGQLLAAFSHIHGAEGPEAMNKQLLRVSAVTAGFSAFAVSAGVLYGRPFLERLLGADMGVAHHVFLLLAPGFLLRFMQYPAHSALYSQGKQKAIIAMTLSGAVAGSLLSVPLAHRWGADGVAAAFGLEMIVCYLGVLPWIVHRTMGLPMQAYFWRALLRPALQTLLPLGVLGWCLRNHITADYPILFMAGAAHALVFALVAPWLLLQPGDRRLLFCHFWRPRAAQT